jgi:hypothetical protein
MFATKFVRDLNAKVAISPPLSPTPLAGPGRIPSLLQSTLSGF